MQAFGNAIGTVVRVGGAIAGGTDTRVLFNDNGTVGEDAGLTYNKTTDVLSIGTGGGALALSSGVGIDAASAGLFYWAGRAKMSSPADGIIRLTNDAQSDFSRLQFGGTTASFPAIARNGPNIQIVVADGTNYASLLAGTILSHNVTGGLGYGSGAGGAVTQATSKSTGVTLNTVTGEITMNGAALAAATIVSFTLNNSAIAADDQLLVTHDSVGTLGGYTVNGRATGAGTAEINVRNNTAGSLSEAIVLKFSVFKSVTA